MVNAASTAARLRRLMADPLGAVRRRVRPGPAHPPGPDIELLRGYGEKARSAGIDRLYLFLSFDCDTDLDIPAARAIHGWLSALGIRMTMAVPGTQLRAGAETYAGLAAAGVEFMNHGFRPHAEWSVDRYVSTTFYHEMSEDAVRDDIRRGHKTVTQVVGRPPLGFRAPHFGMYREPAQLGLIHRTVRDLGYLYCSTTIPSVGHARGPAFDAGDVLELPTFGSVRAPTTILDSWTYLADRRHYALSETYEELAVETVDVMLQHAIPGILTWYVDPCHVADQPPFRRAMEHLARRGVPSLSGSECVALVRGGQRRAAASPVR